MPTRSIIAQQVDGQQRFRAVYCHYDGYPAGVGAILDAHYGDAEKLTRMINGGTIESLRDTPLSSDNYDLSPATIKNDP